MCDQDVMTYLQAERKASHGDHVPVQVTLALLGLAELRYVFRMERRRVVRPSLACRFRFVIEFVCNLFAMLLRVSDWHRMQVRV